LFTRGLFLCLAPILWGKVSDLSQLLSVCCGWFIVYYSEVFLEVGRDSLPTGLCWFILGVAGWILCDIWHSPVRSAECLPSRFGVGIWWWWQPSCFLSVSWHRETFYGLGVQGVKVLILLSALFQLCGSSVSASFLIHRVHTVCFCALVDIMDPPRFNFQPWLESTNWPLWGLILSRDVLYFLGPHSDGPSQTKGQEGGVGFSTEW
jgi:hypothetical protein